MMTEIIRTAWLSCAAIGFRFIALAHLAWVSRATAQVIGTLIKPMSRRDACKRAIFGQAIVDRITVLGGTWHEELARNLGNWQATPQSCHCGGIERPVAPSAFERPLPPSFCVCFSIVPRVPIVLIDEFDAGVLPAAEP